jgi:hypothetical protein
MLTKWSWGLCSFEIEDVMLQTSNSYSNKMHCFWSMLYRYTNKDGIDFDDVSDLQPVQEWDLVRGSDDVVEYTTRLVKWLHACWWWNQLDVLTGVESLCRSTKFSNVRNITLFFPENYGEDTTILRFLGFKGEWSEVITDWMAYCNR